MGGTCVMVWNMVHVDIGSKRPGEGTMDIYKAFAHKKSEGRIENSLN